MKPIKAKPADANQTGSSKSRLTNCTTLTACGKPEYKLLLVALGQNEIITSKNCTRLINALGLKGE